MGIKGSLRRLAEHLTGSHIFRSLPRGVDVFNDIEIALPNYHIDTVFDVGANVGQSANTYVALFPSSCVLCFEPVAETFASFKTTPNEIPRFVALSWLFLLTRGKEPYFQKEHPNLTAYWMSRRIYRRIVRFQLNTYTS